MFVVIFVQFYVYTQPLTRLRRGLMSLQSFSSFEEPPRLQAAPVLCNPSAIRAGLVSVRLGTIASVITKHLASRPFPHHRGEANDNIVHLRISSRTIDHYIAAAIDWELINYFDTMCIAKHRYASIIDIDI